MRHLTIAAAAVAVAASGTAAAQTADGGGVERFESGQEIYDFDRFLEEKHPFPGTYATPSRPTGKRPHLPSREVGPDEQADNDSPAARDGERRDRTAD